MSEYPVGAVCVATVRGVENVRVIRTICQEWRSAEVVDGYAWHNDTHLTDIRPGILLDWHPSPTHLVDLLNLLRGNHWTSLADQIEAQTKPRITEPTGLGAVVKDAAGVLWVRADMDDTPWFTTDGSENWLAWPGVSAVEVLSEGVAQ